MLIVDERHMQILYNCIWAKTCSDNGETNTHEYSGDRYIYHAADHRFDQHDSGTATKHADGFDDTVSTNSYSS